MQSLQQVQITVEKSKVEEMFRETSQLLKNQEVSSENMQSFQMLSLRWIATCSHPADLL